MRKELGMFCALVAMCLVIGISNADFINAANLTNTTRQVAMLGIFAIGVGFVIITGGIDLSIGSMIGLTGVVIASISAPVAEGVTSGAGYPIWVGIGPGIRSGSASVSRWGSRSRSVWRKDCSSRG
jgi:ribose transport system permease protein